MFNRRFYPVFSAPPLEDVCDPVVWFFLQYWLQ